MLTAYDYFTARLLDQAGIDILLVGDSAANVIHGYPSTLPIGMDLMVSHTAAVARGRERALLVADMPFLSYQPSLKTAIRHAGRFLAEGYAEAVKLEGGLEMVATVKRLVECGLLSHLRVVFSRMLAQIASLAVPACEVLPILALRRSDWSRRA